MNVTADFIDSVDHYIDFVNTLIKGAPEHTDGRPLSPEERKKGRIFRHKLGKLLAPDFQNARSNIQSMYFFLSWEFRLLQKTACSLYNGDTKSEDVFTKAMKGVTPTQFAKDAFDSNNLAWEIMITKMSKEELVHQMLIFWTQQNEHWREQNVTMTQASKNFMNKVKAMSWLGTLVTRGALIKDGHTTLQDIPVTYGPPEHKCAARIQPFLERYGPATHSINYNYRSAGRCHKECEGSAEIAEALRLKMEESTTADYGLLIAADVLRVGETVMSELAKKPAPMESPATKALSGALNAVRGHALAFLSPEDFQELSIEAITSGDAPTTPGRPKGKGRKR